MTYLSQDPFDGSAFSRVLSREQLMAWSRYENDIAIASEPAFPSTGLIDEFTRADGPLVAPWATGYYSNAGTFAKLAIVSNAIKSDGTGSFSGQYADAYYQMRFGPDIEAYATISAMAASDQVEITARLQDENNGATWKGYAVAYVRSTNLCSIFRYVNGQQTSIWSTTQVIAVGDSMGIRCAGPVIQFWHKPSAGSWTKLGQVNDAHVVGKGKIAFYVESTTAVLDNVGGGSYWDPNKERGIWFNTPALVSPGSEWAHPWFGLVRSYNPVIFATWREARFNSSFQFQDARTGTPNTFTTSSANSFLTVERGPIAGTRATFIARNAPSDLGQSVSSASPLPTSQITVGAWIRMSQMVSWPNYVAHDWGAPGGWLLYNSDTNVIFGIVDAGSVQRNSAFYPAVVNFTNGEWHFVVGTYDGTTVRTYVDGILGDGANGFTVSAPGVTLDSSGSVLFQRPSLDYAQGPSFVIPTALTDAQVKELYEVALSLPVEADPLDRYHVLSISGWDKPEMRDNRVDEPGDHGETVLAGSLGGRNITITGQIRASNLARLRYMTKRLKEECACVMDADVAMTNMFWRNEPGTLTVFGPSMAKPVQIPGHVVDLKIDEQQKSMNAWRDFQMTIRSEMPHYGIHGAVQVGSTVNLIAGASVFPGAVPGNTIGSYGVDSIIRIGNYPSGAATAAISGSLTISCSFSSASDSLTLTNPVWPPNEWWEIDSRECSIKAFGLSASANNRFSFVDMAATTPHFLRVASATTFISRTGTVSAGTPKFALFRPDNPFL